MVPNGKKRHEGKVATRQMGGWKCEEVAAVAVGVGKTPLGGGQLLGRWVRVNTIGVRSCCSGG